MAVASGVHNLVVEQGCTFGLFLDMDLDLTGLGVRAEMTKHLHPSSPRIPFTTFIEQPAADGKIVLTMPSEKTLVLTPNVHPLSYLKVDDWDERDYGIGSDEVEFLIPGRKPYYWDLIVYDSHPENVVNRFLAGEVLVVAGVTVSV
ncbi:hypothetical protein VB780_03570 [Leptolyngbya sp. CCNP1308]|uniref:hypothetical protein n=1 Tax=Leptolyngbya sp. CCNP1308 TaxID=3110255 RepID=UPI002B20FD71|nr:hypothetical protein [Leptolyngbya sp. CCNP1308]MEA5447634.1 hypothetical protein [Leptolyngbya sp. CCNP1308]